MTDALADRIQNKWRNGTIPWLVVSFALLIALRAPGYATAGFWRAVADLDLIVLGVLVGLLLVPDPYKGVKDAIDQVQLDLTRSPEIISTLTDEAVVELVEGIISVRSSPETASLATQHGWRPIVSTFRNNPALFRRSLDYRVELSLLPSELAGVERLYGLRAVLTTTRVIPEGPIWVSFARTGEALRQEFEAEGCLSRELVRVSADTWNALVESGTLIAQLSIGSDWECTQPTTERVSPDLIRFRFPSDEVRTNSPVLVSERHWSAVPQDTSDFLVKMANYFCIGRTNVVFRINDPDISELDAYPFFSGDLGLDLSHEGVSLDKRAREIQVRTSGDVLLWPSSGVVFVWRRTP